MEVKYSLIVFLVWLKVLASPAQELVMVKPDSIKKVLEAVEVEETIKVDGKLTGPAWQKVKLSSRFIQIDPFQGAAPNFDTKIKVLPKTFFSWFSYHSKVFVFA